MDFILVLQEIELNSIQDDVSIKKSFGDRLVLKVQGRNLMDLDVRRSYSFKGEEYNFQTFNLGRTFSLGLSYNVTKEL